MRKRSGDIKTKTLILDGIEFHLKWKDDGRKFVKRMDSGRPVFRECCRFEDCTKRFIPGLDYCKDHKDYKKDYWKPEETINSNISIKWMNGIKYIRNSKELKPKYRPCCIVDDCLTRSIYGDGKQLKYCGKHKNTESLLMQKYKQCEYEDCEIAASFGLDFNKSTHCSIHKSINMISTLKRCKLDNCNKGSDKEGYCKRHHPNYIDKNWGCSKSCCNFMDKLEESMGVKIQHQHMNKDVNKWIGEEYKPISYNRSVDGFIESENVIIEFHGNVFHGYPPGEYPTNITHNDKNWFGKTYQQLFERTMKKADKLTELGYTYFHVWEHDLLNNWVLPEELLRLHV